MNETMEKAKEKLPARVYSKELIETIFRQPYTKGQFLVDAGIARRQTAAEYLKELERIGIPAVHRAVEGPSIIRPPLRGTGREPRCHLALLGHRARHRGETTDAGMG